MREIPYIFMYVCAMYFVKEKQQLHKTTLSTLFVATVSIIGEELQPYKRTP
jgi:hypothetical protein